MVYAYFKSRALNDRECQRLRMSAAIGYRMRELARCRESGAPHVARPTASGRPGIVDQLCALFSGDWAAPERAAIEWALSYSQPRLLAHLIERLRACPPAHGALRLLRESDPRHLLPREYISPDVQRFQDCGGAPRNALICLTGNAQRLNVSVQLFHLLAAPYFDLLVYLRDDSKQRFVHGIRGVGSSLAALAASLRTQLARECHVAVLGTSSGGIAAARLGAALGVDKLALFSPEFSYQDNHAIDGHATLRAAGTRLYFAAASAMDQELASTWAQSPLATSIRWLDSSSHGTLAHLVYSNRFAKLAAWLGGRHPGRTPDAIP